MGRGLVLLAVVVTVGGCAPSVPQQVRDHNQQGVALLAQEQAPAARRHFEQALRLNPNDVASRYNLGNAAHRLGDLETAEQSYRDCLTLQPNHTASKHGLARVLVQRGRRDEAWQLADTWAAQQPTPADARVARACLLRHDGDYAAAEQELDLALEAEPRNVHALMERAVFYEEVQRYPERAISLYERLVQIDPSQTEVRNRLAALRRTLPPPTERARLP
jgi:Tfp pilus assembly protein PilF